MDKESVASSHSSTGTWSNKGWIVSFIGIISLARIGNVSEYNGKLIGSCNMVFSFSAPHVGYLATRQKK